MTRAYRIVRDFAWGWSMERLAYRYKKTIGEIEEIIRAHMKKAGKG